MKPFVLGFALAAVHAVILACSASDVDSCEELRSAIAYDAPGPWRVTPQELTRHVAGPRTGTLIWLLGGETSVIVNTTLDTESATAVDRVRHETDHDDDDDEPRLACSDSIVMTATVEIITADGGLQEALRVELEAVQDVEGRFVDGWVDLSDHQFSGPLSWRPGDDGTEVFLRLRWIADQPGTLRGWLVWGDSSAVEIDGNEIVGEGVHEVIAQFETTYY